MAKKLKNKTCSHCGQIFQPVPALRFRQKSCSRKPCWLKARAQSRKKWLKKNPNYFKGRYVKLRLWLKKHPGYLRRYRASNPDYMARDNKMRKLRHKRADRKLLKKK